MAYVTYVTYVAYGRGTRRMLYVLRRMLYGLYVLRVGVMGDLHPKPSAPNPQPQTLNPKPSTPNPQPQTLNPKPSTQNPKRES